MEKRSYDKFEDIGRRIDKKLDELRAFKRSYEEFKAERRQSDDVFDQIESLFMNDESGATDKKYVDIATLTMVTDWVNNALPVIGAKFAHVLCTKRKEDVQVCIFFSDAEKNAMLYENSPKCRIVCSDCDAELKALLNGAPFATITL